MQTLAERVKARREHLGATQYEVAEFAHTTQASYNRVENGVTTNPRNIGGIARALYVSPQWLLTGDKEHAPKGMQ